MPMYLCDISVIPGSRANHLKVIYS